MQVHPTTPQFLYSVIFDALQHLYAWHDKNSLTHMARLHTALWPCFHGTVQPRLSKPLWPPPKISVFG